MALPDGKIIPFPGVQEPENRYAGRVFALSPSSPAPAFVCRGLLLTRACPVAVAAPDADVAAIEAALAAGILVEPGAGGGASADVVMTPIVSTPVEPVLESPAHRPCLELYPGFGQEDRLLLRPRGFWRRLWLSVRGWISARFDFLSEFRFRRKMQRYRRNIERTLKR